MAGFRRPSGGRRWWDAKERTEETRHSRVFLVGIWSEGEFSSEELPPALGWRILRRHRAFGKNFRSRKAECSFGGRDVANHIEVLRKRDLTGGRVH